ncbi:hypothetical protein DSO57_1006039 [Entomophthora muscae]|uniref:Uncharacterized protein n=1 Tax=Entomophthora muscae TaxID=34485 RepID=A0ACC2T7Q8_9FUNG|nr:hypothetical protein DSO57_1006039 [Entomophthora muscae]
MDQGDSSDSWEFRHPSLTSAAVKGSRGKRSSITITFVEQRFSSLPLRPYSSSIHSTSSSMTLIDVLRNESPDNLSVRTLNSNNDTQALNSPKRGIHKLFNREKKYLLRRGSVESGMELELGREQIKCHPDFDQVLRTGFSNQSKPTLKISLTPRVAKAGPKYSYSSLKAR